MSEEVLNAEVAQDTRRLSREEIRQVLNAVRDERGVRKPMAGQACYKLTSQVASKRARGAAPSRDQGHMRPTYPALNHQLRYVDQGPHEPARRRGTDKPATLKPKDD